VILDVDGRFFLLTRFSFLPSSSLPRYASEENSYLLRSDGMDPNTGLAMPNVDHLQLLMRGLVNAHQELKRHQAATKGALRGGEEVERPVQRRTGEVGGEEGGVKGGNEEEGAEEGALLEEAEDRLSGLSSQLSVEAQELRRIQGQDGAARRTIVTRYDSHVVAATMIDRIRRLHAAAVERECPD
jgi:hypothetical protein